MVFAVVVLVVDKSFFTVFYNSIMVVVVTVRSTKYVDSIQVGVTENPFYLQKPVCEEMGDELRFALRCLGSSTRPARRRETTPEHMLDGNGMAITVPLTGYTLPNSHIGRKEIYT